MPLLLVMDNLHKLILITEQWALSLFLFFSNTLAFYASHPRTEPLVSGVECASPKLPTPRAHFPTTSKKARLAGN
ncbi:hypothetical protein L209DRAFT_269265 [Thermothelomyces heterothallicus CBS 203.75]